MLPYCAPIATCGTVTNTVATCWQHHKHGKYALQLHVQHGTHIHSHIYKAEPIHAVLRVGVETPQHTQHNAVSVSNAFALWASYSPPLPGGATAKRSASGGARLRSRRKLRPPEVGLSPSPEPLVFANTHATMDFVMLAWLVMPSWV